MKNAFPSIRFYCSDRLDVAFFFFFIMHIHWIVRQHIKPTKSIKKMRQFSKLRNFRCSFDHVEEKGFLSHEIGAYHYMPYRYRYRSIISSCKLGTATEQMLWMNIRKYRVRTNNWNKYKFSIFVCLCYEYLQYFYKCCNDLNYLVVLGFILTPIKKNCIFGNTRNVG